MLTIDGLLDVELEGSHPEVASALKSIGAALDKALDEGLEPDGYLTRRADLRILKPSENNNDTTGSQSWSSDPICFGYDDAVIEDVINGHHVGYYDAFVVRPDGSDPSDGRYSGNQYEGEHMFEAIVIDPPDYTRPIAY
jgi:hypothetical protein